MSWLPTGYWQSEAEPNPRAVADLRAFCTALHAAGGSIVMMLHDTFEIVAPPAFFLSQTYLDFIAMRGENT